MRVNQRWLQRIVPVTPERELNWEQVYGEELPRVYNYFRFRVGDGMLAEDLTATTFEKAWRARERYRRSRGAFSTWLFTIARNVATDYFRRRRPELWWDALRGVPAEESPERAAERSAEFARLTRLLERLPSRERELIALKYGSDLTNREIARLMKLSESNVGTIMHRVTTILRTLWEAKET